MPSHVNTHSILTQNNLNNVFFIKIGPLLLSILQTSIHTHKHQKQTLERLTFKSPTWVSRSIHWNNTIGIILALIPALLTHKHTTSVCHLPNSQSDACQWPSRIFYLYKCTFLPLTHPCHLFHIVRDDAKLSRLQHCPVIKAGHALWSLCALWLQCPEQLSSLSPLDAGHGHVMVLIKGLWEEGSVISGIFQGKEKAAYSRG